METVGWILDAWKFYGILLQLDTEILIGMKVFWKVFSGIFWLITDFGMSCLFRGELFKPKMGLLLSNEFMPDWFRFSHSLLLHNISQVPFFVNTLLKIIVNI